MILIKKEAETSRRQVRFRGISEGIVIDCEEGLFAALLEFAFHHTINSIKTYENAMEESMLRDQKTLFLQLILRKNDVLNRLDMYRAESPSVL
jgi:rubrerythrin